MTEGSWLPRQRGGLSSRPEVKIAISPMVICCFSAPCTAPPSGPTSAAKSARSSSSEISPSATHCASTLVVSTLVLEPSEKIVSGPTGTAARVSVASLALP